MYDFISRSWNRIRQREYGTNGVPASVVNNNNKQQQQQDGLVVSSSNTITHDDDEASNDEHYNYERFPSQLLPFVPERCPRMWTIINNTLAITGCLLIIDCIYVNGSAPNDEERPFAQAYYLIWEFATCFFWTVETGLSVVYQHYRLHQHSLSWYTKLELVIAAYFLITTFIMLCKWDLMKYETNNLWEIILDTSFYVYMAVRSCTRVPSSPSTSEPEPTNAASPTDEVAISLRNLEALGHDGEEATGSYKRIMSTGDLLI